jgi:hypothetical protein
MPIVRAGEPDIRRKLLDTLPQAAQAENGKSGSAAQEKKIGEVGKVSHGLSNKERKKNPRENKEKGALYAARAEHPAQPGQAKLSLGTSKRGENSVDIFLQEASKSKTLLFAGLYSKKGK